MIEFKDIKITPEVQAMIDRGVDPIEIIVSAAEGHDVSEVEAETLNLLAANQGALAKTDHYVFAAFSPQQILRLAEAEKDTIGKIWYNRPVAAMMSSTVKTVGATSAWEDYGVTGKGIIWAVIDSGIDATHEALKGAVIQRIDLTDGNKVGVHGTHVAGIIAGRCDAKKFRGVAPDCKLVDIQVFGPKHNSMNLVIQGMARIREINAQASQMVIHGANLSIGSSNEQNVTQFMPGQSPECQEANRLVQSGVALCVAAGDYGAKIFLTQGKGGTEDYAAFIDMAIADPGNAELPITVGSTHKDDPARYGISPFSAKGPTGDGRIKPDLVAPGEKILSTFPGDQYEQLSGTSQSTPVVSGAAALLMAACESLKGRPGKVKEILIQSCQDLGRSRHFQGAGLIDIKRAIATARAQYY